MSQQPSIKDVAAKAQVSIATVSRVLNHKGGFSKITFDKVHKAMADLGYQPNRLAQALKSDSIKMIALSVPFVWHPFYAEFAYYVEAELQNRGYGMLLSNNQSDPASEKKFLQMAQENKVDGIIGITYNDIDPYLSTNIPFISIDRFFDTSATPTVATITSDNYHGGEIAANELIRRGAKKIAFVGTYANYPNGSLNRKKGFLKIAKEQNVPYQVFECSETDPEAPLLLDKVINHLNNIDGIFTVNDETAYQLLFKLQNYSVKIPEELQLIGYDGFQMMPSIAPSLSSIVQPVKEIARLAVDNLIKLILHSREVDNIVVPIAFRAAQTTKNIQQNKII